MELQFGTNHLGHFALTGRLLPACWPDRPASRVVTVASVMHRLGRLDLDNPTSQRRYRRWGPTTPSWPTACSGPAVRAAGAATASVGAHPGYCHTGLQGTGPRRGGGGPLSIQAVRAEAVEWFTRLTAQPAAWGA